MPSFLPNLDDLKGLAVSLNPLSVFVEPARTSTIVPVTSNKPEALSTEFNPTAITLGPVDSLPGPVLSASGPSEGPEGIGRRNSSGTSIIIMDNPARGQRSSPPKSRKKKVPKDTYCIVKPPSSSSKNPLNLQIQLMLKPPSGPKRDRSVSGISISTIGSNATTPTSTNGNGVVDISSSNESEEGVGGGLSRSGSVGSEISAGTGSSSLGVGSVFSTGTASASGSEKGRYRKRVEPMFNLAVHNMLHTVVTDAATDTRVAKFMKRGVDFAGIGLIEPSEVWVTPPINNNLFQTFSSSDEGHTSHSNTRSRPLSVVSSYTAPLSPTATRSTLETPNRISLDVPSRRSIDAKTLTGSGSGSGHGNAQGENGAKKFFGKIFKKRGSEQANISPSPSLAVFGKSSNSNPQPTSVPEPHSPNPNFGVNLRPPSSYVAPNINEHVSIGNPTFGTSPIVIRRQSSGNIQTHHDGYIPTLIPGSTPIPPPSPMLGMSTSPPKNTTPSPSICEKSSYTHLGNANRPLGYTWTVKKWAKKNQEGWAGSLVAAANAGLEFVGGVNMVEGEDEVVFEWIRMKNPNASASAEQGSGLGRVSTAGTGTGVGVGVSGRSGSRPASRLGENTVLSDDQDLSGGGNDKLELPPPIQLPLPKRSSSPSGLHLPTHLDTRPEAIRRISGSSTSPSHTTPNVMEIQEGETQSLAPTVEDDTDSESPEDNETPWTCSVYVRRTGVRRVLATLTPAVHHPKIIAYLKMGSKIERLELRDIKMKGRNADEGKGQGQGGMRGGKIDLESLRKEVGLSEENIKDVVCVTALWVIAREEFGGFGRKKKI